MEGNFPMSNIPSKAALRRILRQERKNFVANLPLFALERSFSAIPSMIKDHLAKANCIGLYAPYGDEAPALRYAKLLKEEDIATALPTVNGDDLIFRQWQFGDDVSAGPFGIMEPATEQPIITPDILIVPLLGFDAKGSRLGQGGGYYDRYLARHPNCAVIGLAWSVQQVADIPTEPHDRKMHAIITEQSVIFFDENG
jgi:5-formyltetrahydrofolate cyclo-ligase